MNTGWKQKEHVSRTYSILFNQYVPVFRDQFDPFFLHVYFPWWGQSSFALGKKDKSKAKLLTAFVKLTDAIKSQVALDSDYCGHGRGSEHWWIACDVIKLTWDIV